MSRSRTKLCQSFLYMFARSPDRNTTDSSEFRWFSKVYVTNTANAVSFIKFSCWVKLLSVSVFLFFALSLCLYTAAIFDCWSFERRVRLKHVGQMHSLQLPDCVSWLSQIFYVKLYSAQNMSFLFLICAKFSHRRLIANLSCGIVGASTSWKRGIFVLFFWRFH